MSFGCNVSTFDGTQPQQGLCIGKVFHMHREERIKTFLSKDSLTSHTFVTGSTGAGKTNTVCRILDTKHSINRSNSLSLNLPRANTRTCMEAAKT